MLLAISNGHDDDTDRTKHNFGYYVRHVLLRLLDFVTDAAVTPTSNYRLYEIKRCKTEAAFSGTIFISNPMKIHHHLPSIDTPFIHNCKEVKLSL
jgi:hypothetical protein